MQIKEIRFDKKKKLFYIDTKVKIKGKYHHIIYYGDKSKEELTNQYETKIKELTESFIFSKSNPRYLDVVDDFYFYRGLEVSKETLRKDKTQFKTFFNPLFYDKSIKDIFVVKKLESLYKNKILNSDILTERKKYDIIRTFREFLKFCYKHKYIDSKTYQLLDVIFVPYKVDKTPKNKKRVIPRFQLDKLMSVIPTTSDDYTMFSLFIFLGARISEFLGLCYDAFNLNKRRVNIIRQYQPIHGLTNTLKTRNSNRSILLPRELTSLLKDYFARKNEISLSSTRLFPISEVEFSRRLRKYEKLANIPNYAPHEFRHTKASYLASKCKDVSDVILCSRIMGHSPTIFLNTYCHEMSKNKEERFL